jgi:hypothetical protein
MVNQCSRALLVVLCLGCTGVGEGTPSPMTGAAGSPAAGGTSGVAGGPPVDTACAPQQPQRLVLLSDYQASNSIRGLLGETALNEQAPPSRLKSSVWKTLTVGASLVSTRLGWAQFAAQSVGSRLTEVTGCPAAADDACVQTFLEAFAKRAFRRPIQAAELSDLMAVYAVGKAVDTATGVQLAIESILAAPSFALRTELGAKDASGRATLTNHEVASVLSFLLTDSGPDAELMAAADAGMLSSPDGLAQQLTRLLETPAVQATLNTTLLSTWGIGKVFDEAKDPTLFPQYTPALQASMYKETELFVSDKLWGAGPLSALFTSETSFVDAPLAALYGVPHTGPAPTDFVAVTLPAGTRAGLLTQASVLASRAGADVTSVVRRGLFVRTSLLCLPKVPPPPNSVQAAVQAQLEGGKTEKELATERATTSPCNGCHALMDPPGLLLESYDPIGRYRTDIAGVPVDASADLSGFGAVQGTYQNALQFAKAAANAPEFKSCMVRHLLTYALADDEVSLESCSVTEAAGKLPATDVTFRDIAKQVGLSPALWLRSAE